MTFLKVRHANLHSACPAAGLKAGNDKTLAEKIRLLRPHGMTRLTWDRHRGRAHNNDVVALGCNYRFCPFTTFVPIIMIQPCCRIPTNDGRGRSAGDEFIALSAAA